MYNQFTSLIPEYKVVNFNQKWKQGSQFFLRLESNLEIWFGSWVEQVTDGQFYVRASGLKTVVALFVFSPFPGFREGEPVTILEVSGANTDSGKYSTWPTSTASEVQSQVHSDDSLTSNVSTHWYPSQLSDVIRPLCGTQQHHLRLFSSYWSLTQKPQAIHSSRAHSMRSRSHLLQLW